MISRNIQGYEITYFIENVLRQYLIKAIYDLKDTTTFEILFGKNVNIKVIDYTKNLISNSKNIEDDNIFLLNSLYKEFLKNIQGGKKLYNPVYYLTMSDLISILRRSKLKEYFINEYCEEDVTILLKYLDKMLPIRNSIAHNRNISEENIRILIQIKECLITQFKFELFPIEEVDTEDINLYLYRISTQCSNLINIPMCDLFYLDELRSNIISLKNSYWNQLFYPDLTNQIDSILEIEKAYQKELTTPGGVLRIHSKHKLLKQELNKLINSYE